MNKLLTLEEMAKDEKTLSSRNCGSVAVHCEGFNRNLTATEIENGLSLDFSRNIEVNEETAGPIAVAQQQSKNELNQYALQLQTAMEGFSRLCAPSHTRCFLYHTGLERTPGFL
ncbi:hypothetical protein SAMN05428981_1019 [Bacillus sp. OV194]|nr:hypothetical protein SAMN05428981_1019 [Bacillus sp. OV194]